MVLSARSIGIRRPCVARRFVELAAAVLHQLRHFDRAPLTSGLLQLDGVIGWTKGNRSSSMKGT
jgi:hypothetical protein